MSECVAPLRQVPVQATKVRGAADGRHGAFGGVGAGGAHVAAGLCVLREVRRGRRQGDEILPDLRAGGEMAMTMPEEKPRRMGRRPNLYLIEGRMMTANEIAAMLGVGRNELYKWARREECGFAAVVAMFRSGQLSAGEYHGRRHRVHGRWMTIGQAAAEVGVKPFCINRWRSDQKKQTGVCPTLEAAYDHYRAFASGEAKRYGGRLPAKHRVHGRMLTVQEAGERYHYARATLWSTMSRHQCSLQAAVDILLQKREDRAVRRIVNIIGDR